MPNFVSRWVAKIVIGRPGMVAVVLLVLAALSGWRISLLHINNNQLDLIPQDNPSVVATKQMIDVVGGVGFLLIAIKGEDPQHLRDVADDLGAIFTKSGAFRTVRYKQDVDFVREHIAYYVEPADLEETYRRIHKKIRATLRKANPFHIELRETADEPLKLDDIIEKYTRLQKKNIDEDYNFDPKKEMLLFVIKPMGDANDLDYDRKLMDTVDKLIAAYNTNNTRKATLAEGYKTLVPGATVTYGYTGSYKRNLDDSDTIKAALAPTSILAASAIACFLLLFFIGNPLRVLRERRFFIFPAAVATTTLLMAVLGVSVVMSFAMCELTIGELNSITALLGSILGGVGIDFGILFTYRLREEYSHRHELIPAVEETIIHSGAASLTSALTFTVALLVLTIAEFKGFAHFGWVTAFGVIITFVMMYTALPVLYLLIDRIWPRFKESLIQHAREDTGRDAALDARPFPFARRVIIGTILLSVGLAYWAFGVGFDYDSRSLMTADRGSIVLQEEINRRFEISSDPVGVYAETLDEAKAIYDTLTPIKPGSTMDSVISLFLLVPPVEKQQKARAILDKLKADLAPIQPDMLEDNERAFLKKAQVYLDAQPFTVDDVPIAIASQFRPVPESRYKGYLTFIYPNVDIWNGQQIISFGNEISSIKAGGKTYYTAGMAVLFGYLAHIVLRDGRLFTLIAAPLIFLVLLLSLKKAKTAVLAMVPLVAGMCWMLGLMSLTGWHINFMNIVVFPVVFGYGISGGVQLVHRYLENGSVMLAIRHTGAAVAASCTTAFIGWASLLVSNHLGLESMGILASFGVASALAVCLTVLPAILQVASDRQKAGEAKKEARA
jgi:uncharacterized protein